MTPSKGKVAPAAAGATPLDQLAALIQAAQDEADGPARYRAVEAASKQASTLLRRELDRLIVAATESATWAQVSEQYGITTAVVNARVSRGLREAGAPAGMGPRSGRRKTAEAVAAELPAGLHMERITETDPTTREEMSAWVVWADRADRCPRCPQPVDRDGGCPAVLDQTGDPEPLRNEHGCGEWIEPVWDSCADPRGLAETVARVHARYREAVVVAERRIRADLADDLSRALARLAEPLEDGETRDQREAEVGSSGSEPGIYQSDDGTWLAWDYHPYRDGEQITVTVPEVAGVGR